ncbi:MULTISPECIES: energy transducer TonB [Stenotrophomonas]|uniref:energy transducer TonB n=1 Tax=Stenotrophomonas TaxID=40323 RepID=UPI0018D40177|nr:energy transducer TonB [Stenotrophomonas sp.]MBH1508499.1 energy transducer TonB [Stenotrophomonas maltophilia]
MMRSHLFLALALAVGAGASLLPADASAQTTRAVRATTELSMTLTGKIEVTAEGTVSNLVLDQKANIGAGVAAFVERTIRPWRFEPTLVDGKAVAAQAPLRVRLRGKSTGKGDYEVSMTSVDFSEYDPKATDSVTAKRLTPPRYPDEAIRVGGQGDVVLIVKVARDGTVADVIAEQVNMTVAGPERTMAKLRDVLAKASINTARKWTFIPPTSGEEVSSEFWSVRVPVSYAFSDDHNAAVERNGRWRAFIPGPKQRAPWVTGEAADTGSDLLPEGGVYMVDSAKRGLRLLTPLEQG